MISCQSRVLVMMYQSPIQATNFYYERKVCCGFFYILIIFTIIYFLIKCFILIQIFWKSSKVFYAKNVAKQFRIFSKFIIKLVFIVA